MSDAVIALSTCPDADTAKRIAETLVTERLAACVNRLANVQSTYIWDGCLQDDAEVLLIIKTTEALLSKAEARVKALHPYELPEWLVLGRIGGSRGYLEWLSAAVG
jgi:periplasmic divalent cation tolerance protein